MSFYGQGKELDMLEDALEAGGIAWWMMEIPSGAVFFSENKIKMLGYTSADAAKFVHYKHFTDLIHPDDYDQAMASMKSLLSGEADIYETRYRIKTKQGGYVVYYDRGRIVGKNNKVEMAIAGIVLNVTDGIPTFESLTSEGLK